MIKKYCAIGEVLQQIKCLKPKSDTFALLKWNWGCVFDPTFAPIKYNAKTRVLTISCPGPVFYFEHMSFEVIKKCNDFLGFEGVSGVKFIQN